MTAAAFRATYSDWRLIKGRKVVQVVFELPLEQADQAYDALGGMPNPAAEVWCGIARLDPSKVQPAAKEVVKTTNSPSLAQPASATLPGRASPQKRLAQRAGILCADPVFRKFLSEILTIEIPDEDTAADHVRGYCGVDSRADITPGSTAGVYWDQLETAFIAWRDHDMPACVVSWRV